MFDRGKKRHSPRQSPIGDAPQHHDGELFGQPQHPRHARRTGPGDPDVDEYMLRSIMGVGGMASASSAGGKATAGRASEPGEAGPDSIMLRIELPIARAEQLRVLARDLDESPQMLARLWIMERLRELGVSRSAGKKSNGSSQSGTVTTPIPELAGGSQPQDEPSIADVKKHLADTLISDPEERAVFDETYTFRQWGPYIASLALAARGRRVFTLEDIRVMLRDELMPDVYDTPGALDSDLVIRDIEVGRPGDQLRPFACLQRVSPGVYTFLGFGRARAMRAAR